MDTKAKKIDLINLIILIDLKNDQFPNWNLDIGA